MNIEDILKEILEQLKEINDKLTSRVYYSTTTEDDFQAAANL